MIRSSDRVDSSEFKPDLTPLLDIIFIVMVFLLLTANIQIKTMTVDIPTTDQSQILDDSKQQVITVNLLPTPPYWAIDEVPFSDWASFSTALVQAKTKHQQHDVIIGSDKSVPVEKMLQLLAFMQQNKIDAASIIMKEEN